LLGRVERRRRFSVEQELAVLTEATAPGANLSEVARRHGLVPAQVYKWRRLAELGVISVPGASELPSFVAVEITKDVPSLPSPVPKDKPAAAESAPRRRLRTSRDGAGPRPSPDLQSVPNEHNTGVPLDGVTSAECPPSYLASGYPALLPILSVGKP
jgi:transposase-like protein